MIIHQLAIIVMVMNLCLGATQKNLRSSHRRLPEQGSIVDLSKEFMTAPSYNQNPGAEELINIASREPEVLGLVVLEHGEIVTEYYKSPQISESTLNFIWSCTKSWTSLLFGIMEDEGEISLDETLGDIWPDPEKKLWGSIRDAEERKEITIEALLTLTSGLTNLRYT